MKTIVAGSRGILGVKAFFFVNRCIRRLPWTITEVVSGTARGVDQMGESWARLKHVPIKPLPADWDRYGNRAGFLRNMEMAAYGEALLAIWDGRSPGTRQMIEAAKNQGLRVVVERWVGDGLDC